MTMTGGAALAAEMAHWERLFERWLVAAGSHRPFRFTANTGPAWTPATKPLATCQVALVSTAGVHRTDQPPFDIMAEAGDWSLRIIPDDTPVPFLRVSHAHYNNEVTNRDVNCVFPLDALHAMAREGLVGRVASRHYGLMGYVPDPAPLLEETGPDLVRRLRDDATDVVVFTPG